VLPAPRGRRLAIAVAALSITLLPVTATAADRRDDDTNRDGATQPYRDAAAKFGGRGSEGPVVPDPTSLFLGYDGGIYSKAGWTVKGRRGAVYLGEEFDSACLTGDKFKHSLKRVANFAKIIRSSGRRVIFTVAPSKSAVYKRDLPLAKRMPHGSCDADGIKAQDKVLDTFKDPSYINLRSFLADQMKAKIPVYWTLDSHWTTLGSTQWGQAVAYTLDPAIQKRQRYKKTRRTHIPDIAYVIGNMNVHETQKALRTVTKVTSTPDPGSPPYSVKTLTGFDLSWTTTPQRKVWPGRTLLMGDSFTYLGMESLIPLFNHGRFMWTGHVDNTDLIQGIVESDTVVIEVAQRYVATSLLGDPATQLALTLALAASPKAS